MLIKQRVDVEIPRSGRRPECGDEQSGCCREACAGGHDSTPTPPLPLNPFTVDVQELRWFQAGQGTDCGSCRIEFVELQSTIGTEIQVRDNEVMLQSVQLAVEVRRELLAGVCVWEQPVRNLQEGKGPESGTHFLEVVKLGDALGALAKVFNHQVELARLELGIEIGRDEFCRLA